MKKFPLLSADLVVEEGRQVVRLVPVYPLLQL
jgi:hypothetical protein